MCVCVLMTVLVSCRFYGGPESEGSAAQTAEASRSGATAQLHLLTGKPHRVQSSKVTVHLCRVQSNAYTLCNTFTCLCKSRVYLLQAHLSCLTQTYVSLSLCLSVSLFLCLAVSLSVCLSLCLSLCLTDGGD